MRFRVLIGATSAALLALAAGSARAAVYCVPAHAGCSGFDRTTLAAAMQDANLTTEADDIYLGLGTFQGGVSVGAYPVHIHGEGRTVTTIEGGGGSYGLGVEQDDSSVEDLTIHELPGGHATALSLYGSAQRVTVDQRDNAANAYAAVILHHEASFTDGAALAPLSTAFADYGISADSSGPQLISDVLVQGRYGISTDGPGPVTIRFARITGNIYSVNAAATNTLIEDSTATGAELVSYLGSGTSDVTTTVRHVTLNGTFAGVESDVAGHTARMDVSNTAVVGGDTDPDAADLYLHAESGATAVLNVDYSFFRAGHVKITGAGTKTYTPGSHNIDGADARLVNLPGGDLRPLFDSPLVDAGDPTPGPGEPMADLAGEFRAVNNRTDIGAYEYGRHTPTVYADADPKTAFVGDAIKFNAGPADADPDERPVVTWLFDDGATATGEVVTHAFATPGGHLATATATDPAGLTATASITVSVSPRPVLPKAMAPTFGFKSLNARKGVVRVLLRCPVIATDCAGAVSLRLGRKILGRAGYKIAHGTKKAIKVRLSRRARSQLRAARRGLRVKVRVTPKGAASRSKTVRLIGR